MSKTIHLISVGSLRINCLQELEQKYITRLSSFSYHLHEVKASGEDTAKEAWEIKKKINEISKKETNHLIILSETGKNFNSLQFSEWLNGLLVQKQNIIFVQGGAMGIDKTVKELADNTLSLSPLTFTHQMARIIFLEQIYRAQTIINGHPYHN